MKYACEIDIALPRDRVVELFDNPDNLKFWLDGLVSFVHRSGERGHPGAVSDIVFQMGKRRVAMVETIEVRDLPREFTGIYTTDGLWNRSAHYLSENPDGTTHWLQENEFRSDKLMMKLMTALLPVMFRRQTATQMRAFKAFAEGAAATAG